MLSLPYWDSSVDLDIQSWVPFWKDYSPISVNLIHSEMLQSIASLSMELGGEFLYLNSLESGMAGSLMRNYMIAPHRDFSLELGLTMVFGYSRQMESVISEVLNGQEEVLGGVTDCAVWDRSILVERFKTIVLISSLPLHDEKIFFENMEKHMFTASNGGKSLPFFAERFGYRRFFISYETDDPLALEISAMLQNFEFDATREVVGPPPDVSLPMMLDIVVRS